MANTPAQMPNFASKVTITAVKSGNASDPTVWGRAWQDGDWPDVSAQFSVVYDLQQCPNLAGFNYEGTVDFGSAPGNKVLNVGTLFGNGGHFQCGSCINNVPLSGTLTVNFLDGVLDPVFDPGQFSRGWLMMGGTVDMCGSANKTARVWAQGAAAGSTTLTLQGAPAEWNPGDTLLLPTCLPPVYNPAGLGSYTCPNQDELVTIGSISGTQVTLTAPLTYDHLPLPGPTGQVNYLPVGNLTRNIVFQSANPNGTRGHVMFMRDMMNMPTMVNACHALVKDMGRTLATQVVTDPLVDANGVLVPGTAANPRARYAWHSHKQGQQGPDGTQASCLQVWDSLVVWGFKKWGFDNHDSNVNATNLIAYDGQGAGLATERGTEIGVYDNCLSLRTSGSTDALESRRTADDYGFRGHGCWLQGPGVKVTNCVFGNHPDSGFFIFTTGDPVAGVIASTFPSANLAGTSIPVPANPYNLFETPYFGISGNVAFSCPTGHHTWEHEPFDIGLRSAVSNLTAWNCPIGLDNTFTSGLTLTNLGLAGPGCIPGSIGCNNNNGYSRSLVFVDPQVAGFESGLLLPTVGSDSSVQDGTFGNVWDFITWPQLQPTLINTDTLRNLTGTQTYLPVDTATLNGRTRLNYKVAPFFPAVLTDNTLPSMFFDVRLTLPSGQQVYFREQAANYVPIPVGTYPSDFPLALVGLTNQQLWADYGLAIAGCVAPTDAASGSATDGLLGDGQVLETSYRLVSPENPTAAQAASYRLSYIPATSNSAGDVVTETTASPLVLGWNLLTRTIKGIARTFFVYGPASVSPPAPPAPPAPPSPSLPPPPPPPPPPVTTTVTATLTTTSAIPAGTYTFSFVAGNQTGSGTFTVG